MQIKEKNAVIGQAFFASFIEETAAFLYDMITFNIIIQGGCNEKETDLQM